MDVTVYTPLVVADTPFPVDQTNDSNAISSTSSGVPSNTTTQPASFPVNKPATELLTASINTKARKILQNFDLEQHGGIKIGQYEQGVSGEIAITPSGLTAKNQSGVTTIAIDGDTGDATFAGELQTGSIITGEVLVQGGFIELFDSEGIPSIFIGEL